MVVSVRKARCSLWYCLMRVLVVDDQGWRDDAGAESPRRPARGPAIEDQLHLLGSAEIEVLTDHLLEEQAAVLRLIEHLGQ